MTRMEILKIKHDLFWASQYHRGFDKLFGQPKFLDDFTEFLKTSEGQEWLKTDIGKQYHEWQVG